MYALYENLLPITYEEYNQSGGALSKFNPRYYIYSIDNSKSSFISYFSLHRVKKDTG